jgi:tRNA threonylcarbamoyladenosine biosynthesis protein TsaB
MNLLALETTAGGAAVAALTSPHGGLAQPLAVRTLPEPRALARDLIAVIAETVSAAGWEPADIDALAVGTGPGSWTSLRIALSTARTLAQTRQWKLAGVPSYDALAAALWRSLRAGGELPHQFLLMVAGRCRAGELYGKIYLATPTGLAVLQAEWAGPPQMMADTLCIEAMARGIDAPPLIAGDAAAQLGAFLDNSGEAYRSAEMPIEALVVEIGRTGQVAIESGEAADPLQLTPLYLAPSAAERCLLR